MKTLDGRVINEVAHAQGATTFALAVPSDSTAYTGIRALYCSIAGTLSVKNSADTTVAIVGVAGQVVPISPAKILAATTGTWIILY